jgi:hypothetical protein
MDFFPLKKGIFAFVNTVRNEFMSEYCVLRKFGYISLCLISELQHQALPVLQSVPHVPRLEAQSEDACQRRNLLPQARLQ